MTVPIPNLDNRTFEQLLKEARRSIPHYAPEWTNHNPADPGISLLELFAWLAEIASYRINLVTEEHLLKYLKLLGVRPRGSQSAITYLSFTTNDNVDLEKGTVFSAEKDGENIDFVLLEDITIIPFQLKKIIANEIPVDSNIVSPNKTPDDGTSLDNSSKYSFQGKLSSVSRESISLPEKCVDNSLQTYQSTINSKHILSAKVLKKPAETIQNLLVSSSSPGENSDSEHEYGNFDRSNENTNKDLFFAPFGQDTWENSKLYLGFERNDKKISESPKHVSFMCYLYEKDLIKTGKHGDEQEYEFENTKLKWEISISDNGNQWKEVFPNDRTRNFMRSGFISFNGLENWKCSLNNDYNKEKTKYFWLRCTLLGKSRYEYPPRIESICLNTAPAIQKKRLMDLVLGKSNGLPGQVFKLSEAPVLRGNLKMGLAGKWDENKSFCDSEQESTHFSLEFRNSEIRFGEGRGILKLVSTFGEDTKLAVLEEWNEVEDFDGSKPNDTHFTLESQEGKIRFGDGIRGRIPPKDTEIRVIEYETGKGKKGNLPANSRWTSKEKNIRGLKNIENHIPATGGNNEESIDEAFERFIRDLKVPYRAVTSEDFEYIARETPGLRVAQAKAIQNFNPYRKTEEIGTVTVVVVPFSPLDTFKIPPKPSRGFREAVAMHLGEHRLLGTRVYVVSPDYVKVEVQVTLGIVKGFFKEDIKKDVLDKLNLLLHPTKGGFSGKGWPVGKPVYLSEIYLQIIEIKGVDFVQKITIKAKKGADMDENGNLILKSTTTVYSGKHSVTSI